jgi:hypothetical protein
MAMTKEKKLILLRGLNAKAKRLQTMTRDHYNADGWDHYKTEEDAARLLDEMADMITVLRTELL